MYIIIHNYVHMVAHVYTYVIHIYIKQNIQCYLLYHNIHNTPTHKYTHIHIHTHTAKI